MNRRRESTSDSLDLLLDTMCNAFGGIVFMAMLLALIAQQTKVTPDTQQTPDAEDESRDIIVLADEYESLQTQWTGLGEIIDRRQNSDVIHDRQQIGALEEQNKEIRAAIAKHDEFQDEVRTVSELVAEYNELLADIEEMREAAKDHGSPDSRKLREPMYHQTNKIGYFLLAIRNKRLYYISNAEFVLWNGNSSEFYDRRCVRTRDGPISTVITLIGEGQPLNSPKAIIEAIRPLKSPRIRDRAVVQVGVDPDSFRDWIRLKEYIVQAEIQYNWYTFDETEIHVVNSEGRPVAQ